MKTSRSIILIPVVCLVGVKVKFSHTRYRTGLELILVNRQAASR